MWIVSREIYAGIGSQHYKISTIIDYVSRALLWTLINEWFTLGIQLINLRRRISFRSHYESRVLIYGVERK